jgi:putative endonuclease
MFSGEPHLAQNLFLSYTVSMSGYCVYILANKKQGALYIGVTNDLVRRVYEHKNPIKSSFSAKYDIHALVYFEQTSDVLAAIAREKQLKAGSRNKKIALIEANNPEWGDLYFGLV